MNAQYASRHIQYNSNNIELCGPRKEDGPRNRTFLEENRIDGRQWPSGSGQSWVVRLMTHLVCRSRNKSTTTRGGQKEKIKELKRSERKEKKSEEDEI